MYAKPATKIGIFSKDSGSSFIFLAGIRYSEKKKKEIKQNFNSEIQLQWTFLLEGVEVDGVDFS